MEPKKAVRLPDAIYQGAPQRFTVVPHEVIRHKNLSAVAKTILMILLSNQEGWTSYQTALKNYMKEGLDSITNGIRLLEREGFLKRVRYRDCITKRLVGSFWSYTNVSNEFSMGKTLQTLKELGYEIIDKGNPRPGNPTSGNPTSRESHIRETPVQGIPPLRITSIKKNNIKEEEKEKKEKKQAKKGSSSLVVLNKNLPTISNGKKMQRTKARVIKPNLPKLYANYSFFKDAFQTIWLTEFLTIKHKKKASCSDRALNSQLKKIKQLSNNDYKTALQILKKSVDSGWTDFYPLKPAFQKSAGSKHTEYYTKETYPKFKGVPYQTIDNSSFELKK
jgi:hypothetical protein